MNERLALRALARDSGIQLAYRDLEGHRHRASTEGLLAILRALGLPLESPAEALPLLQERWVARLTRRCEPVTVAWADRPPELRVFLQERNDGPFQVTILTEDGSEVETLQVRCHRWEPFPGGAKHYSPGETASPAVESLVPSGVVGRLTLPRPLPVGYYDVHLGGPDGVAARTLLMVRPRRVPQPEALGLARAWGLFLPLYALWRDQPTDGATYARLAELASWNASLGGQLVGTLPLLPTYLQPNLFDPSPYAPVSRLFWSEFFVDVEQAARSLGLVLTAPLVTSEVQGHRFVDYGTTWRLRKAALAEIARRARELDRTRAAIHDWLAKRPEVLAYARFRSTVEHAGPPSSWPDSLRNAPSRENGELDEDTWLYVVAQWLAAAQLAQVGRDWLYLDLPLGVHAEGFDVWRWPELFVGEVSAGAPPDPFFAGGQVWGFPPLHPERNREDGYRYLRAVFAHHLWAARLLRIDHVMGFHRLYWVPRGASGRDGIYVRYPAEELYAVLAIESHRAGCAVAGEDLGTVPQIVRRTMARNGLLRLYVLPFARQDGQFADPPALSVASLDTHDLPPFAALWDEWGPVIQQAAREWLRARGDLPGDDADEPAVLRGFLRFLGESSASIVLINLEDLWLEREPQNRPGTGPEQPNWRRMARYGLTHLHEDATIARELQVIAEARRGGPVA